MWKWSLQSGVWKPQREVDKGKRELEMKRDCHGVRINGKGEK